ncbi:hypothetical protein AMAG_09810 [Allomyces macrogynus ATCC 38327]|uniref:Uncharacterized protein n=1 Tax=Allomyces macrogynus (strain ATCC 38327) TaxID=578462 RepID=A0A0L0STV6_ALLM3|nr:hypothetical protein AMAG_09810 [Allomyces macrogynus ATCC 38327]|eukprot:KNE65840.1 hypothetical protein AMAG_09810 [Allomyces macrogynus ATCC 38327]
MYCAACKKSFATAQTWGRRTSSRQNVMKLAEQNRIAGTHVAAGGGTAARWMSTTPSNASARWGITSGKGGLGPAATADSTCAGDDGGNCRTVLGKTDDNDEVEILLKLKKAKAIEDGNASLAATVYWNIAQALWTTQRDPRDTAVSLLHLWKLLAKYTDMGTAVTLPPLQLGIPPERRRVQVNLALARLLSTIGGRQAPPRDLVRSWAQQALPTGLVSAVSALVAENQDSLGPCARTTATWLATASNRGTQAAVTASARVMTPARIGAVVDQWVEKGEWTAPELSEVARPLRTATRGSGWRLRWRRRRVLRPRTARNASTRRSRSWVMLRGHGRLADVVCWATDALAPQANNTNTTVRARLAEIALEDLAAAVELNDVVSARCLHHQAGAALWSDWIELQWVAWCVRAPAAPPAHRVAGHMLDRQVQRASSTGGGEAQSGARRGRAGWVAGRRVVH